MKNVRLFASSFLLLIGSLFVGASLFAQSGSLSSNALASAVANQGTVYLLQPSDVLEFNIFGEPEMQKVVRVEADGTIRLPFINQVRVAGMTLQDAQERIYRLYDADYFVNPQVALTVLEFSPRRVQVLGQVNRPGFVEIAPDRGLTLVEAIAGANGFTRMARKGRVSLKRSNPDGTTEQMEFDVDRIMSDPDYRDIPLRDGDIIHVPERVI